MTEYKKLTDEELIRRLRMGETGIIDYLMEKYDTSWGQDTTRPFIMENDTLMDGYRPNPLEEANP